MREPAATMSEPALSSPLSTPVCSSSTREAASMLPSSWPPTTTVSAFTPPVRCAPGSMVRLPCTFDLAFDGESGSDDGFLQRCIGAVLRGGGARGRFPDGAQNGHLLGRL